MAKTGDTIRIKTDDGDMEGILMPRPSILKDDMLVLKLGSGYNIGVSRDRIKSTEVIAEREQKTEEHASIPKIEGKPNISIISMGGTISSKVDYTTGGVYADYTAEDFIAMMPELADMANLSARKVASVMSEDMTPDDWLTLAHVIEEELKGADGVVVSQGTDTLHFTSAALSFFFADTSKPIIVTASQRSIDRGSSDAFMNLSCSIAAASHDGIKGVYTCLHGSMDDDACLLIPGTRARKMHSSRRDAFRPVNGVAAGDVLADGTVSLRETHDVGDRPGAEVSGHIGFERKVGMLYCYPGMEPSLLDAFKGYNGLVIVGTGLGNIPQELFPNVKKLIDAGVHVVITTQTLYGATHPLVYQNLRKLSIEMGAMFVSDMLPEVAYVKLGWLLSQQRDIDELRELMQQNLVGEISYRQEPDEFLS